MAVIAIINHKGGVGKTTTTVNLGAALQEMGKRVLLVDLDPQASLTIHVGIKHPEALPANCGHVLKAAIGGDRSTSLGDVLTRSSIGLDLIPAGWQLDDAEALMGQGVEWAYTFRDCLRSLRDEYDYVLVDCLPGRNFLVFNAVAAADAILVPLQTDYLAVQGLALTFKTAVTVQQRFNPRLKVLGVLLTMANLRTKHSQQVISSVRDVFADKVRVFETIVPTHVSAKDSSKAGTSVLGHGPRSKSSALYRKLAEEVVAAATAIGLAGTPAEQAAAVSLEEVLEVALAEAERLTGEEDGGERGPTVERGGDARVEERRPVAVVVGESARLAASPAEAAPSPSRERRPVRREAPAATRPIAQPAAGGSVKLLEKPPVETAAPEICPFLGLSDDRTKQLPELNYAHRCWAGERPVVVDLPMQQKTCLQAWYWSCPRHLHNSLASAPEPKPTLLARLTSWLHR